MDPPNSKASNPSQPLDKPTFATKWCIIFRDLVNTIHADGASKVRENYTKVEESYTAFQTEGGTLGFKEADWPMDVNLPGVKHSPGDENFHFTNPFTAAELTMIWAKDVKNAIDMGIFR